MKIKVIVTAAGLALAAAGCGAAAQHQQPSRAAELQCERVADGGNVLAAGTVHHAEPIHFQRFYAGGPQPDHVVGAKLYVPAEAGQSDAYLERALSCHVASGRAGANAADPLGADGVERVSVRAEGSSFAVSIVGRDAQSGDAIWQRARALAAQVGVRQVASNGATGSF